MRLLVIICLHSFWLFPRRWKCSSICIDVLFPLCFRQIATKNNRITAFGVRSLDVKQLFSKVDSDKNHSIYLSEAQCTLWDQQWYTSMHLHYCHLHKPWLCKPRSDFWEKYRRKKKIPQCSSATIYKDTGILKGAYSRVLSFSSLLPCHYSFWILASFLKVYILKLLFPKKTVWAMLMKSR